MPADSMNTMITLRDDSLKFSFPEIRDQLRSAVENHVKAVLPGVIAEDRKPAIEALRTRWIYRHADQAEQSTAEDQVLRSSPSEIEKAFRKLSLAAAESSQCLAIRESSGRQVAERGIRVNL